MQRGLASISQIEADNKKKNPYQHMLDARERRLNAMMT